LKDFLQFITFAALWSAGAGLLLETGIHPLAIFAVWLIGFVWGAAYIADGKRSADHLTKRWLQMMIGVVLIGGVVGLLLS
jgi:hypothetical protein